MRANVLENDPYEDDLAAQDLFGLIGEVVADRFRILDLRHSGARSLVYEAEPPGVGKSRRALKVIMLPEAREPDAASRLERFVERLRSVEHPHLERIFELGRLPDQTPFVLTEWLPINTLSDGLAHGGRLPTNRAVDVVRAVASALDALHSVEVAHGDVRPGHVLARPSRSGFTKIVLVGAGITASLEAPLARGVEEAETHQAPELIMGMRPTLATDVYSLGALAYLLLAGRPVFEPSDKRADSAGLDPLSRLRWLHLNVAPFRPSEGLGAVDFSSAVEAVLGKALSKAPDDRYPNAKAFSEAFEAALATHDTPAPDEVAALFAPVDSLEAIPSRPPSAPPLELSDPTPPVEARVLEPEPAPVAPTLPLWAFAAGGVAVGLVLALLTR